MIHMHIIRAKKYYLRPLGTEGQGSEAYPGRKPYNNIAFCIPLGVGFKYNLNPSLNLGFEITYNFTTTDYLDDVSTTYAGISNFPTLPNGDPSLAAAAAGPFKRNRYTSHWNPGTPKRLCQSK